MKSASGNKRTNANVSVSRGKYPVFDFLHSPQSIGEISVQMHRHRRIFAICQSFLSKWLFAANLKVAPIWLPVGRLWQIHFSIWTNTFWNFDKYSSQILTNAFHGGVPDQERRLQVRWCKKSCLLPCASEFSNFDKLVLEFLQTHVVILTNMFHSGVPDQESRLKVRCC